MIQTLFEDQLSYLVTTFVMCRSSQRTHPAHPGDTRQVVHDAVPDLLVAVALLPVAVALLPHLVAAALPALVDEAQAPVAVVLVRPALLVTVAVDLPLALLSVPARIAKLPATRMSTCRRHAALAHLNAVPPRMSVLLTAVVPSLLVPVQSLLALAPSRLGTAP